MFALIQQMQYNDSHNKEKIMTHECIEYNGYKDINGYGKVWDKENKIHHYAHRAAYADVHGEIPQGMVVRHLCHNKACVNPEHLAIGTHADNVRDKVEANRQLKGEDIPSSKLTEAQVKEIKELKGKMSGVELAKKYNVSNSTVCDILKKRSWRHVNG